MTALEQRVFDLTNLQRSRRRLRPLAADAAITDAARRHSEDMLRRRFFAHVNPDGKTPGDRIAAAVGRPVRATAENIWMRSGPTAAATVARLAEEIVTRLMASPPHRTNMLNVRYTHLGVGVAVTASELRATQLFARVED